MNKQQSGFTLIEMIAVIVILGILAAVAIPKFVDLSDAAAEAAAQGVAGSLGSASALNFAAQTAYDAGLTSASTPVAVDACTDISGLLEGGMPTGFTVAGTLPTCTVTHTDTGKTADFVGHTTAGVPSP